MPVLGDLSVLHAIDVNGAEANLATIAFQIFEAAGEMSREAVSNNGAIVHDQKSSISAFRSGMAARKFFDASSTPLAPCRRPEGRVRSTKFCVAASSA